MVDIIVKGDDVIDTTKTLKRAIDSADTANDIRRSTGSYEIIYKSGKNYVGKGNLNRAITSAKRYVNKYGDEVQSIHWKSAPTHKDAFIDEYCRMLGRGVRNKNTYNLIWSPGRAYFMQCQKQLLK